MGGLLALEHVWHGEVVPWSPFLMAMQSSEEWAIALHEVATAGVTMALATVGVCGGVLLFDKLARMMQTHRVAIEEKVVTTLSTK